MYTARQQVCFIGPQITFVENVLEMAAHKTTEFQSAVRSVHESRGVSRYLLQRVGSEAARLSCFSRYRIVTRREILEAWNQLRRRRNPAALAGA